MPRFRLDLSSLTDAGDAGGTLYPAVSPPFTAVAAVEFLVAVDEGSGGRNRGGVRDLKINIYK